MEAGQRSYADSGEQPEVAPHVVSIYAVAAMGKRIRRDERTSLMLTTHDRDLILDRTLVDGALRTRIENALTTSPQKVMVRLSPDELDELLEWIAFAANHVDEQRMEKELDALYDRVQRVEDSLDVYEA